MTHLGAGIDKFQLDILQSLPLGMDKEGLNIRRKIIHTRMWKAKFKNSVILEYFFSDKKQPWVCYHAFYNQLVIPMFSSC